MTALPLPEAVEAARARGFVAVQTYGGPLPLADWRPYGPAGVGIAFLPDWPGSQLFEAGDEDMARAGFVRGVWPLLRDEVPIRRIWP